MYTFHLLLIRKYNQTLPFNHVFTNQVNTHPVTTWKFSMGSIKVFLLSISILDSSSKLSGIQYAEGVGGLIYPPLLTREMFSK